jgi:uncharacterized protein YraI
MLTDYSDSPSREISRAASAGTGPRKLISRLLPRLGIRSAFLLAGLTCCIQISTSERSIAAQTYGWITYSVIGVSKGDVLNIRAEPGPSAKVVGSIPPNGSSIIPLGSSAELPNATWLLIDYLGSAGWVDSKFLRKADEGVSRAVLGKVFNAVGIGMRFVDQAAQTASYSKQFTNKCPYKIDRIDPSVELSFSDEMLGNYRERGFTLKTLCLATTTFMTFDVQSGIVLPNVRLFNDGGQAAIPLNIPDCFRNGTPLLDCQMDYDWFWGKSAASDMPAYTSQMRTLGVSIDHVISQRARSAVSETFTEEDGFQRLFEPTLADEVSCNGGCVEFIEIAQDLPRGYAYRLATRWMGGDSPEGNSVLKIGSKETKSTTNLRLPWNVNK